MSGMSYAVKMFFVLSLTLTWFAVAWIFMGAPNPILELWLADTGAATFYLVTLWFIPAKPEGTT